MENEMEFYLQILDDAIHGRECVIGERSKIHWDEILKYGATSQTSSLVYDNLVQVVQSLPPDSESDKVLNAWKAETTRAAIGQMGIYFAIRRLQKAAEEENLTLIYFKGCVLADLYPKYTLRVSADSDIYVAPQDQERAVTLLERLGYEKREEGSNEQVPIYVSEKLGHKIELHFCLWEDYQGSKMEILKQFDLTREDSLITLSVCNGIKVMTLNHTNHLIFQIFHIVKHFAVQGISMRYVTDVTLFVERYQAEIDWEDFWAKMKRIGYDAFVVSLFTIGVNYFGLHSDVLMGRACDSTEKIAHLVEDFLIGGEILEHKDAGWQILGIMTPYFVGEEEVSENQLWQKLKVMFPSSRALPDKFGYAKRHPVLLPAAWVHKGFGFLHKRMAASKDWYSTGEKLTIAEHRLNLMREQELVGHKQQKMDKR